MEDERIPAHQRRCVNCISFTPRDKMKDLIFGGYRVLGACSIHGGMDGQDVCSDWSRRGNGRSRPLGDAYSRWSPTESAILRECANAGLTMKETAFRLGRREEQVAAHAAYHGVRFNGKRGIKEYAGPVRGVA